MLQCNSMKLTTCKKTLLSVMLVIIASLSTYAQQTLWVGQSYTFDVSSSVMGITSNMSWSTNGGYLSLSGSGFYRTITVTQYFSGTATVTCEWDYRLTGSGSYTHTKRQVTISCRDNQVSISPTSMTMSPGETRYVSYRHQYDNQYTSAANAYFQSTNPSVARVNERTGEVYAVSSGTAYINVYSKVSSTTPYCLVKVNKVEPTSVSIPKKLTLIAGEQKTITPTTTPSNAQTSYTWTSSNNQIATVSSSGTITAMKHGTTYITVKTSNGLSSTCEVCVNKSKLSILSSHNSQILQLGTPITLSASAANSTIYYTLNGENPSINSFKYTEPIVITEKATVKAFAVNEDYLDSDILTLQYDVTDLALEYSIPQNQSQISWNNFAITLVFNKDICRDENFSNIKVIDPNGLDIHYTAAILQNAVMIIPDENIKYGKHEVIIPTSAVKAKDNNAPNIATSNIFYNNEFDLGITAFDTNGAYSFIVKEDGSLWSFGANTEGQLGDGTKIDRKTPVKIMDDVIMPIAGWNFGMAIKKDNSLWTWGGNTYGQLGDGTKAQRSTPKKIKDNIYFANATSWSVGQAIDFEGILWVWGENQRGNLGDGTTSNRLSPVKILSKKISYATGGPHSAAISADNDLYMWGSNNCSQLGDGSTTYRKSPVKVKTGVKDVNLPYCATIVLYTNGEVWTWGNNDYGQLGTGNYTATSQPQKILENIVKLGEFSYGGFAINSNHELYAWGRLSTIHWNTIGNIQKPTIIMRDVEDIKCAYSHALIKKTDGSLWGVGENGVGQLGIETSESNVCEPILLFPGRSPEINSVKPLFDEINIEVGEYGYIPFNLCPADGAIKGIDWLNSNDYIEILDNGRFEGKKVGTSIVECIIKDSQDKELRFKTKVNVSEKNSSVEDITIDNIEDDPVIFYNLHGIEVSPTNLTPGIYVKRQGSNSQKIIIK